jgi:hypothetical protein
MFAVTASSPNYLRKIGVNRLWPTVPVTISDMGAAMPTGFLTDVAEGTKAFSAAISINDAIAKFNANGPKLRLIIK